jgi:CHAD domain-containing protein
VAPTPAINADAPTRLLRDRVRRVFRYLPKSLAGDEEALHQLRVWGRRLRVGLPVLARKPEGKRVRRSLRILRQMTRTAGASRDHDVMAGLLEVRLKALPAQSPALRVLRRRLQEARGRSRRRMANGLLDLEIATLRRDLRRAVARRGDALFTVLLRLRQARDSEGEEASTALLRLQDAFEPDALHRLRIVVRRLRYLAEVLDVLRGQPSEAPACCRQLQACWARSTTTTWWPCGRPRRPRGRRRAARRTCARRRRRWRRTSASAAGRSTGRCWRRSRASSSTAPSIRWAAPAAPPEDCPCAC